MDSRKPLIFEWKDNEKEGTGAIGWVVLDGVDLTIAGGGIFMHSEATCQETCDIAKNMSYKFTVTAPTINGAKAGIRFDHRDPRAKEVLRRFIIFNAPLLKNIWVTAGDLNTDDMYIEKVIQEDVGLQNCQATLGRKWAEATGQPDLTNNLKHIIQMPATQFFPLIEGAVGYGLAESIFTVVSSTSELQLSDIRVAIQGFGAVGCSLAYYLHKKGAKVIGIADKDGYITCDSGFNIPLLLISREYVIKQCLIDNKDNSKNIIWCLTDEQKKDFNHKSHCDCDLGQFLANSKPNVFSPCAIRYQVTPGIIGKLIEVWNNNEHRYIVSGANNSLGIHSEEGKLIEDHTGTVLKLMHENNIISIPDWISNSGTAQLFHRGLSVPFDLEKDNINSEILEACADPIRAYINVAKQMGGAHADLYYNCLKLRDSLMKNPLQFKDQAQRSLARNPASSRYALPPPKIRLPLEERIKLTSGCFERIGGEVVNNGELHALLSESHNPVAYDGFEPSGILHVAQVIMKKNIVNRLTKSGFTYLLWVADWFAFLNHKLGGNMDNIKLAGEYMIETWKACGMDMDRVQFLWASEEFDKHGSEYWATVLDISTKFNLDRVVRCTQIMGRGEKDKLSASQILYPCMQCADIFFLGVDVAQLGLDQRKVNMLARDYATVSGKRSPIIMSHPMIPGLKKGQEKASKSNPDSAIFMSDTDEEISRKVKGAFCPDNTIDINENPCLAFFKLLVYESDESDNPLINFYHNSSIETDVRPESLDGHILLSYNELESEYQKGNVTPQQLKSELTHQLQRLVGKVRNHFTDNERAAELQQAMSKMMKSVNSS